MKDAMSKAPILRLLLPFVVGVLFASYCNISNTLLLITALCATISYLILESRQNIKLKLSHGYLLSIPLVTILICMGAWCSNIHRPTELNLNDYSNGIAIATIEELNDNDFSTSMLLTVTSLTDSCGKSTSTDMSISAWMESNNYTLHEGDIISFKFSPQRIHNAGNPEEFDYSGYMHKKGILYQVFIKQNEYRHIGTQSGLTYFSKQAQRNLINLILSSSLNPDTKTFFITILLGDSSFLERDTRESFVQAGISHILALSGLHIGIITLLLSIIFMPLDHIGLKRIRLLFTILIIIAFAFLVGMPISVTRATIMIIFVLISRIIYRENVSLNALFGTALFIMIINPYAIYDIGFQFSFTSVLLILLLAKKLTLVSPKKETAYYICSLITISIISSIGTMWLTAYYFNIISIYAIFTNIIIIPLLPFIVGCGLIYLILLALGIDFTLLSRLLNHFYEFTIYLTSDIAETKFAYIDNIYISLPMLCLCTLILILVITFIYKHKIAYIYGVLICIGGMFTLHYIECSQAPSSGYVIFSNRDYTPILTFNNGTAAIWIPEEDTHIKDFQQQHRRFFAKYKIQSLKFHDNESKPYIILNGKKVMVISNNEMRNLTKTPKIDVDILLITRGYYGKIEDLMRSFNPQLIVLCNNLYHTQNEQLSRECRALGINYHEMNVNGAIYEYFN